jgi:ketosteroid isomerase-like protein
MMLRYGLLFAGIALSTLLTGCATPVADTHDADVTALKDTEAAWVKDAATKDLEKWVTHYTDDASVLLPDTPIFTGKDAIRGGLKPMMSDPNFAVTFAATKVDVAKSGDLGYTQGTYSLTLSNPKTKAPVTEKGKYLTVYRKQTDGTWKSVQDTFMSDAPPPAEAGK